MKRIIALALLILALLPLSAQNITTEQMTQLGPHPRLILQQGDVARLREAVDNNEVVAKLHSAVMKSADKFLDEPVSVRKKQGKRLLTVCRNVLERVLCSSYAWLMTGEEIYAERAEREMLAAAEFEDWNPSHFLDVAEMTTALALGYDWLYDYLSEGSRRKIVDAIVGKGLLATDNSKYLWFYNRPNNWNQVCNCGMILGSLAAGEQYPELAAKMVEKSLKSNPIALKTYAPDGVYCEGIGYWSYGTWYQVLLIEALRTALGSSYGLEKYDGFVKSADFVTFMDAPTGKVFNYSDGGSSSARNPLLAWFAKESGDMSYLYRDFKAIKAGNSRVFERRMLAIAMFFLARCDLDAIAPPRSNIYVGRGEQPLFVYRGGWDSKSDVYFAAKGGSASLSHGHMDAGSFVYEWGGVRWSIDLGSQNYYSLESKGVVLWKMHQESQRWDVFRIGCQSHSTLTVKDSKHLVKGSATMGEVVESSGSRSVSFDLSSIFSQLSSANRTFAVTDSGLLTVVDDVVANEPCTIRWTMCTQAQAEIVNKNLILLEQAGKRCAVRVVGGKVKPFILSNDPPRDYDCENPDTRRVGFDMKVKRTGRLVVELVPMTK